MRRVLLLLLAGMFIAGCFSLYMMLELQMPTSRRPSDTIDNANIALYSPDNGGGVASPLRHNELNNIETKIKQIEEDLQRNHKTISDIRSALHDIVEGDAKSLEKLKKTFDAMDADIGGGRETATNGQRVTAKPGESRIPATRFVMPSDKWGAQLSAKDANASKLCLLTQSQSKVRPRSLGLLQRNCFNLKHF